MKNTTYDILKYISLIIVPAIATFFGVIGEAWTIPNTEKIVITINALSVLLGTIINKASSNYIIYNIENNKNDN